MPLAWGADYYLVGSFTNWANNNDYLQYQFTESNGTYSITKDIPANAEFQIVKVDGNYKTWFGAKSENSVDQYIYHNCKLGTSKDSGKNFKISTAGTTSFTFKIDQTQNDPWPYQLEATRTPKLSLKFNANATDNTTSWSNLVLEDMTLNDAGWWTITKAFPANSNNSTNVQFCFVDEFGQDFGWIQDDNSWYWIDKAGLVDGALYNMKFTDGRYIMRIPGEVSLSVNSDLSKLSVTPSLAVIENSCDPSHTYTVADDMQVVFINSEKNFVIARDLTGTTVNCPSGKVDYMTTVAKEHSGPWEQFNWVMLHFTTTPPTSLSKNCIIKGGSLKGWYNDPYNYTINVDANSTLSVETGTAFTPNVYCPANFGPNTDGVQKGYQVVDGASVGESATVDYWLMTPKRMEVFELSGALWYNQGDYTNKPGFYMEKRWHDTDNADKWFNPAGLKGGIGLNTSNNSTDSPSLVNGQSYRFLTVAWYMMIPVSAPSYGEPLRGKPYSLEPEPGSTLNDAFSAGALNLTGGNDQIVTGVSEVKSGSEVVSVTYCDLAGRMSQKPFAGVNIIVTRYSDGSTTTQKVIR